MRMDGRVQENAVKLEKSLLRKKKAAVFLLVFFFYMGLAAVDTACTEMTRHSGALTLQSRRIDEDHVQVSFLGRETTVNTAWIALEVSRMKESAAEAVSVLTKMATGRGDNKPPQDDDNKPRQNRELPFPSQTL